MQSHESLDIDTRWDTKRKGNEEEKHDFFSHLWIKRLETYAGKPPVFFMIDVF